MQFTHALTTTHLSYDEYVFDSLIMYLIIYFVVGHKITNSMVIQLHWYYNKLIQNLIK